MRTSAPAWTSTGAPGTDERASTRPSNGTGKATLSGVNGAALAPPDLQSGEVEHQHLSELDADEPERGLRTDGGAVPVPQGLAVERHGAARDLHPRVTLGAEFVNHLLLALEQHRVEAHVLMEGHDRGASSGAGNQAERAPLVRVGDRLLLVARLALMRWISPGRITEPVPRLSRCWSAPSST